ncbi:phosphatidate cytidylyltransferase [Hydrogenobacter thermophilus TK-6]|uniref:Phosphatidate cytidylyltransferase n=1 Tax=Hydrogenobacter thermophilus (strain DSM 6534 / IAM 12695 / TK-6) TaxID=608538 RepID=D3DJQ0_HYDTT|nr:phosphatidate cytidylyltransferase [Hydrogenobacter thermophilus]ADO45975.1 phosphatidate cytidylyltransferase [Hydrogenobacter thermophilus TK-6]BAI70052.1 hypothetical protein HTH_1604 [Hydrogenobacter thermophilus TK-6]
MLSLEVRRKLFHLIAISLWIVPLKLFPPFLTFFTFLVVIFLNILVVKKVGQDSLGVVYRCILYLEREKNLEKPSIQALWANLGIMLSFLMFGGDCATIGVILLAVGDAFASLVGYHLGRTKLFDKSLEGFLAFFLSSFLVLYFILGWGRAIILSLFGALIELLPLKVDDNLTLPLAGSFLCYILEHF